jgi:hypothetical protein
MVRWASHGNVQQSHRVSKEIEQNAILLIQWVHGNAEQNQIMNEKGKAYEFLRGLHETLSRTLPPPSSMRKEIDQTVSLAKHDENMAHLRWPESVFVNAFATPLLSRSLVEYPGMSEDDARKSFLSESFRSLPEYCSGTPARRMRHPFNKALNSNAQQIYSRWEGESSAVPLTQSCPDFAFRSPFPFSIVFEAKYFQADSQAAARRELVTDAYQAFFYRALPPDHTEDSRPDWGYDYSCLFAYDASPGGHLVEAWESLSADVKAGFWEGANVYVMILRGQET